MAHAVELGPSHWQLTAVSTLVCLAQMASLAPLIWLLERYVPQLVGRPRVHGPLLPALVDVPRA